MIDKELFEARRAWVDSIFDTYSEQQHLLERAVFGDGMFDRLMRASSVEAMKAWLASASVASQAAIDSGIDSEWISQSRLQMTMRQAAMQIKKHEEQQ